MIPPLWHFSKNSSDLVARPFPYYCNPRIFDFGISSFEIFICIYYIPEPSVHGAHLLFTPLICPGSSPPVNARQAGPPRSNQPLVQAPHLFHNNQKFFFGKMFFSPVNHVDCDCVSPAKQRDGSQLIVSQLLFLSIDTL